MAASADGTNSTYQLRGDYYKDEVVNYLPEPSIWTPRHALMNTAPCISSPGVYLVICSAIFSYLCSDWMLSLLYNMTFSFYSYNVEMVILGKELYILTGMETRQLFCRMFVALKKFQGLFHAT